MYCCPCWCQVEDELEKERGALSMDEQVQLLLQSLQHDSASVQATAVQASPVCLTILCASDSSRPVLVAHHAVLSSNNILRYDNGQAPVISACT